MNDHEELVAIAEMESRLKSAVLDWLVEYDDDGSQDLQRVAVWGIASFVGNLLNSGMSPGARAEFIDMISDPGEEVIPQ